MRPTNPHQPGTDPAGSRAGHHDGLVGTGAPGGRCARGDAETGTEQAAEAMVRVAAMIEAGKVRAARRFTESLLTDTDEATRELLGRCLAALETPDPVRVERLRWLWRHADADGRTLIEACQPRRDARALPRLPAVDAAPTRAPGWTRQTLYRAPRDLGTRRIPAGQRPQPKTARQARADDTGEADAYLAERAPLGEQDARDGIDAAQPDYDQLDYDRAAVPALRGTPCVWCNVERSSRDQHRRPDDGLCEDCRDTGRPGIPALPAGHTRAEAITARCAHLAAAARDDEHARRLLRAEWRRAPRAARGVIAGWVGAHLTAAPAATSPGRPDAG